MSNNNHFPLLKSRARIGKLELRNRFVLAAMGSNFAEKDGTCGERIQAYYENQARGGVGLIVLETSSIVWPAACSMPHMVGFSEDRFIPGLTQLADRVHKHGARIAAQLNHSGKVSQEDTVAGRPLWVPSLLQKGTSDMLSLLTPKELGNFIKAAGPDGKGPSYHVMDQADILALIQQFAAAARRAKQAGFDALEIHAGHGYIISSFLSPAVNKREDQYGGSLPNRARLLTEIIRAVRAEVGADMPILVRLDAKEYRIEGGITPADFVQTAKLAEEAGADAIDVSAYGNTAKGIAFTEAPLVHQPGGFLEFAKMAKAALSIPIIAVGRVELDVAEKGLATGHFDFVAMGRKLLADPTLPSKVMADQPEQIRPCIYCYICVSQIFINQPLMCAVNPNLGNEHREHLIASSNESKRIIVVGSGPGGMEAAKVLAERGHRVSLWEKERDLGGTARIAALAYEPNGRLIRYLADSLRRLAVDIQLGKLATLEALRAERPDHVIVATGAARKAPEIPGKHLKHVFDGDQMRGLLFGTDAAAARKLPLYQRLMLAAGRNLQLLRHIGLMRTLSHFWMPIRKQVVIIGGGLVGLEMAEFLVARGRKIVVLEPTANLGPELSIVRRSRVVHLLKEHGVELVTNADIRAIESQHVTYQLDGKDYQAQGQQVIIALGASADTSLADQLQAGGLQAVAVGDCKRVGYIDGAIHDARAIASTI
ncbi:MAG: FAD-dependent oxidoreductase [Gammaproteobacteria bacterium]|uniref:oxidoreductase n=1 Tax=Pseudomaricurvus alcaniphilus TaxID=1166482 RepID=UPI001408FD49|nr:FAD-dependent oxidoreductase [Pseudomaricurvus alcaniphilus]MBR9911074.1 FAD-dependent oxidoreductase [Gammaproteobacteria bacterium]NHN36422.1 FAD-dependent oxidoreductase [Pseudomaricurvus alcaniphilus]